MSQQEEESTRSARAGAPLDSPSPPLTVSQLTRAIKHNLESTFPSIVLQGEVSNFKLQTSGHLYFSLKDEESQIAAVMFKQHAAHLKVIPKGGEQVVVKGDLNVYPPKGNYQLMVRELSYLGLGALLAQLEALKIKLHQLGWFKTSRKRPLPPYPRVIGVVTSPTGAVIQDIIHILTRRFPGFHLILNPVKVQGEGAAEEIAVAIEQFNTYRLADVLIIGRGGGSLEDLWAFNEEKVAAAIFHSHIPTISAVGHETDHCIADYVADRRAPTPSAAAEIVLPDREQLVQFLNQVRRRLQNHLLSIVKQGRYRLDKILSHPLYKTPLRLLEKRAQQIDDAEQRLRTLWNQIRIQYAHALSRMMLRLQSLPLQRSLATAVGQIARIRSSLDRALVLLFGNKQQHLLALSAQLDRTIHQYLYRCRTIHALPRMAQDASFHIKNKIEKLRQRLNTISTLLQAYHPHQLLARGYTILFDENRKHVIESSKALTVGQKARLLLADGELLISIDQIHPLR